MNDSEAALEIQTPKDVSEIGMVLPQEFPPHFRAENDEEKKPLQYLPDESPKQGEQYEMVSINQIEYMTGPQIIHEYRNLLCCYYYKQVRRVKKKEDIESGRPNKITRVVEVEAKEWLLGLEPVSDELYVWALKASAWACVAYSLLIIFTKLIIGLYFLVKGSDMFVAEFSSAVLMIFVFGGCYLWQRRIIKTALKKNDMSETRKQYKLIFIVLPFICGFLLLAYTLSFIKV